MSRPTIKWVYVVDTRSGFAREDWSFADNLGDLLAFIARRWPDLKSLKIVSQTRVEPEPF